MKILWILRNRKVIYSVMGASVMSRLVVEIVTEWDIVAARQLGSNEAKGIGFSTVDQAGIATAISELARNIYLYALVGEIVIERIEEDSKIGIRVIATEKRQGINDRRKVKGRDFSTSSGLAEGLPGVKRLVDNLEIQSEVGRGTVIKVEKWLR